MSYDPLTYWNEAGKTYAARFDSGRYVEQEKAIAAYLASLDFDTVLDVGCGFGRMRDLTGSASHVGIDIAPTMIAAARKRYPGAKFVKTTLSAYKTDDKYDLVLAVEFLMHVPPAQVKAAVTKLLSLSAKHVVAVDWTEPVSRPTAPHNFLHDYRRLFGRRKVETVQIGSQTLHHLTVRQ